MKDCVSCGDGEHRMCAGCNRDLRRERACPVCLAPIERRQQGRRVLYVHPATNLWTTCVVAEGAPWQYTTGVVYLVVAT